MSFVLRRFIPTIDINRPFDCGDNDLNNFLLESSLYTPNATVFDKELLASTYIIEDTNSHRTIAYFSILHDKIERKFVNPTLWNRLSRRIPNAKRHSSYPALKIGRIAVSVNMKGHNIGTKIIDFVKTIYLSERTAGCRFVTVDAYRASEPFYQKCNFEYLVSPSPEDETALMYFDLKSLTI